MFISQVRSEDAQAHRISDQEVQARRAGRPAQLEFDKAGKIWFDTMYQGSLGTLDPKTGEITYYPLAPHGTTTACSSTSPACATRSTARYGPRASAPRTSSASIWRPAIGRNSIRPTAAGRAARRHLSGDRGLQEQSVDGRIRRRPSRQDRRQDLQVTWFATPTPHARARRMEIDDQDRILVTEYRGNKVALFDTKTETVHRIQPAGHTPSRTARNFDKNGEIWASTMSTDRVVRHRSQDRQDRAISDAVRHQYAHGVRRQFDDAGDVLGRQQPRPSHGEGRAARLTPSGSRQHSFAGCSPPPCGEGYAVVFIRRQRNANARFSSPAGSGK